MKRTFRVICLALLMMVTAVLASAQERQVVLEIELPAKKGLVTSDISLGGKVFLPAGNFTVVGDLNFRDAVNLFLVPTDQITAEGQVWYYLTGRDGKAKPFVFGGLTHAMFIGVPADSTAGIGGFGLTFKTARGSHIIPVVQFSSEDLQDGRTVLGTSYSARVYTQIKLSSNFNLNLTPVFKREYNPTIHSYGNVYQVNIGFSRVF